MNHPVRLFALVVAHLLFGAGMGCRSAVEIHTIRSPLAHFDRYRTVAFDLSAQAPRAYTSSPHSAGVREHIEPIVARALEGRGYVLASNDHADLVVRIETGRREHEAPIGTMPLGGGVAGLPSPSGGDSAAGGVNVPGPAAIEPSYGGELDQEEKDLVEGAFVIDAFDAQTHTLVWHGSARTEVQTGPVDLERLRRAVESVMASFPASAGH
ncbi:MAG: DUF4136 domain-containing protein [Polyangiaceae bacterium]|jgi:hypothetical protein